MSLFSSSMRAFASSSPSLPASMRWLSSAVTSTKRNLRRIAKSNVSTFLSMSFIVPMT